MSRPDHVVTTAQRRLSGRAVPGPSVQGQISDSTSNANLAEFVALRGNNGKRMDFDQLNKEVQGFASRLRCRLDNSHVPAEQKIACLDPAARAAREAKGPVVH
jgi:hypothetical protein